MATRFYLRVGAWYKSETGKSLTSDIDITDVVNNTDPNNPFIEDDGSLGGAFVASITAGANITLGGTVSNPIINATGGGVALENYQNSAMSVPVMAYVFRDADNNIFGIYEPNAL